MQSLLHCCPGGSAVSVPLVICTRRVLAVGGFAKVTVTVSPAFTAQVVPSRQLAPEVVHRGLPAKLGVAVRVTAVLAGKDAEQGVLVQEMPDGALSTRPEPTMLTTMS